MPIVSIVSKDWSLRATVRAELRNIGVEALGLESVDDLAATLAQGSIPSAIVLDAALIQESPAAWVALENLARRVPVVVVASPPAISGEHGPALEGAAAVLHRPVRVGEIVSRVQQLLAGQAA